MRVDPEKYGKPLIESMDKIIKNLENDSDSLDASIEEFEMICHTAFYEKVMEGFFYEFGCIISVFEFFVRIKDRNKSEDLGRILYKHYTKSTEEYLSKCLKEEKYEILAVMTKVK